MKTRILLLLTAVFGASAQTANENGPGVIRVTTTLVQLDAVVTDGNDRPVPALTREDFQIFQDGKPRPISTFSMISAGPRSVAGTKGSPAKPITREQVRRTIALVVDDFSLNESATRPMSPGGNPAMDPSLDTFTYQTTGRVREALTQFMDRDAHDGDLMALLILGRHAGGYEQFTTDRELLKSVAARLQFSPMQLMMMSAQQRSKPSDATPAAAGRGGSPVPDIGVDKLQEAGIAALQNVIDGMKALPGRKSIVLISTRLTARSRHPGESLALQQLITKANRAGVTFYTIDPRAPARPGDTYDLQSQIGLATLASQTGGRSWGPNTSISERLGLAMADQENYYLLGYNPSEGSFDRRFHKIEVKVLRSGLHVRSRSGFDGQVEAPEIEPRDPPGILSRLLSSPYAATTVRTMLSTFYSADGGNPTLRSVVFVDGRDLEAEHAVDGTYKGGVEMMVAIIDPKGDLLGQTARAFPFSLTADEWRRASETGMVFVLPHPAKDPGPYQVRLAVRDITSGAGSASTFLDIPNLKKTGLTLSGVALLAPASESDPYPLSTPAVRTFRQGREIAWLAEVYNARDAKAGGLPQLQTSVRVLRDGQVVLERPPEPTNVQRLVARKDVSVRGGLTIGALEPGEYVFQLIVRDQNASAKTPAVVQFTDFRVVP